ncbi:quinol:cytochrome C oxidoreductase [Pararhodonellum marinum]|uniref:quinol:cytochrome C oxidoreductase n=1 Tax=Pararhodonellum marinum TaxID=2755358 RepID=UPI00188EA7E0|nr:quinol:cytochrome C oxidoreductase [Pararhodonellum marinum]
MAHSTTQYKLDQKFEFTAGLKKTIFTVLGIGAVILIIGMIAAALGGHDHANGDEAGHAFHWYHRVFANLWINNVYFTGIAIIGVFFFAIQYAAQAGWSAGLIRIFLSFGYWLPFAAVLMIVTFFLFNHDLFHWTHSSLFDKGGAEYDKIIDGKGGYFYWPLENGSFPIFFIFRMVAFFAIWGFFFNKLRTLSYEEDIQGGTGYYYTLRKWSAIFLVFFAVSSSVSAWDWVLSIDTHWFSTMFGWYVFASWFVAGLAAFTLVTVFLKERGYLEMVNENHIHDLGKFVFAFSIFWTYIWFSQFLLIYYANIPEETFYFVERLQSDVYSPFVFVNLVLNFFLPFLVLMTRDAKRHAIFLKVVCSLIILGHWFDFFLMVQPGTLGQNGGFGLIEFGMLLVFGSAVAFVVLSNLSKRNLIAKNHPLLEESYHHHI